jgi:hypothetical protein
MNNLAALGQIERDLIENEETLASCIDENERITLKIAIAADRALLNEQIQKFQTYKAYLKS